jgi:hypothetical protein
MEGGMKGGLFGDATDLIGNMIPDVKERGELTVQ